MALDRELVRSYPPSAVYEVGRAKIAGVPPPRSAIPPRSTAGRRGRRAGRPPGRDRSAEHSPSR